MRFYATLLLLHSIGLLGQLVNDYIYTVEPTNLSCTRLCELCGWFEIWACIAAGAEHCHCV